MHDPVREHNVLVLFVLLAGTLVAQYPGEPKTETVEVAKNQFVTKKYCAASTTKCECSKDLSQQPQDGCVQMVVEMGRPRYSALTDAIALQLNELEPTSRLYSPDGFCVVAGYTVSRVTREKNAGGVPKWVRIITKEGVPSEFVFEDGDSVGRPLPGMHEQATARLAMVDAQGWATAADPAYYDYYPGDGSRWRFGAAPGALDYLQFVEHQTPVGRMETKQDIGLEIVRDGDGVLRQVVTPTRLADLVVRGQDSYDLAIYPNDASCLSGARTAAGVYEIVSGAVPEVVWKFRNPTPGVYGVLEVTREKTGADPQTWRYQYVDAVKDFTLTYPGGLVSEHSERLESDDGNSMVVRKYKADAEGVAVSKGEQYYEMLAGSYVIVKSARDPDGLKLTRRYEYYKDAPWTGLDRLSVFEDSSWTRYEYDDSCRVTAEIRPWLDAPTNAPNNQCAVTRFNYTVFAPGDFLAYNDQRPRTEIKEICGIEVARTYHAYPTNALGQAQEIEERAAFPGAPYGHASTPRTVKTCYAANAALPLPGRLATVVYPGGKTETYGYEYGAFNAATFAFAPDPDGGAWRETVTTSYGANSGVQALRSARVWDEKGREVLNESYVEDGAAFALIGWTRMSYDRNGKLIETAYSDGRVESATWGANCCGKESVTSADGTSTVYGYNLLKQKTSETKKGMVADGSEDITTLYTYDLENHRLSVAVTNIASGLGYVASCSAYDAVGRLTNTVDRLGNSTVTAYNTLSMTVQRPNGVIAVAERYLDGKAKRLLENGVVKQSCAYGVNLDGTQWTLSAQGPLPVAIQTTLKLPNFSTLELLNFPWQLQAADPLGRTVASCKPGFGGSALVTSNGYDIAGNLLSLTQYASSPSLVNPVTLSKKLYSYAANGALYLSALDLNTNGIIDLEGPDRIMGTSAAYEKDASNTWCQVSRSWVYPEFNSFAAVTTSVQRVQLTGLGIQQGDGGVLVSHAEALDVRGNVTVSAVRVDRMAHRVMQVTTLPTSLHPVVQVKDSRLLRKTMSSTAITNTFDYDALGRKIAVTDGRGNTTFTVYNSLGLVSHTEDAASNRTTYAYDALGRRTEITDALGNVTHMQYDADGRMTKSWGATYPVECGYDALGRMVSMKTFRDENVEGDTKKWKYDNATGLLTQLIYSDNQGPTYTYTPDGKLSTRIWARGLATSYMYYNDGSVSSVDYSDDTPDVTYVLDRQGNEIAAITSVSTNRFTYSATTLDLVSESQNDAIIKYANDAFGRTSNVSFDDIYEVRFLYDENGRVMSVLAHDDVSVSTNVYTYMPGSGIATGWSAGQLRVSVNHDTRRDAISQVINKVGTEVVSQYDYDIDAIGRRQSRKDSGLVYTRCQTNTFQYNSLSELTNAVMDARNYCFMYDWSGNRRFSVVDQRTNSYVVNGLSQYTQINDDGGGLIAPSYDRDGNLVTNGLWSYTWDAENRFVSALSNGVPVLIYKYDFQSRCVQRIVHGTSSHLIYNGWNLVSEFISDENGVSSTNFYCYGPSLYNASRQRRSSGSLWFARSGRRSWYYAYDANENVCDLVNENGDVVGHYEYGPFGGVTKVVGVEAPHNPFRFSAKYFEPDVNLSYYGYRLLGFDMGAFINRDPLAQVYAYPPYRFVENDAINSRDILGLLSVESCQENADNFMSNPGRYSSILKSVLAEIAKIEGCNPLSPQCKCCTGDEAGYYGYVSGDGASLFLCSNNMVNNDDGNTTQKMLETLVHENIYVLQKCQQKDDQSCDGAVCAEIQAALHDGGCQRKNGNVRQCVIDSAAASSAERCGDNLDRARERAEALYNKCNSPIYR